jgi:hypothetical protein
VRAVLAIFVAVCVARCAPVSPSRPSLAHRGAPRDNALHALAPDAHVAQDASVTDASVAVSDASIAAPSLDSLLERHAIDDDAPWRETLYSWLPPDRARQLARDRLVLSATPASGSFASPFSRLLLRLRSRGDDVGAIARALLYDPGLNHYRYAWASGFATALGFRRRSYGTALVSATLRPDALVLRLDPSDRAVFRLFDREQREVEIDRFADVAPRIAAVYHVRRRPETPTPFREYVLCNESALASWSVGTPEITAEISAERALVASVLESVRARSPGAGVSWTEREWRGSTRAPERTLSTRWASTMATAADHYALGAVNLVALLDALDKYEVAATVTAR